MFKFNNNTPKEIIYNTKNVAKLVYNGVVVWLQRILYTITGVPPLTANKSFGEPLEDYKIYGESEQDGEPTPEIPIEIKSVGDLITDQSATNYGKYKIPVKVNNTITNIYLDEPLRKMGSYLDYIDFKNKKCIRKIKELIFNGTENWTTTGTGEHLYYRLKIEENQIFYKLNSTYQKSNFINYGGPTTTNTTNGIRLYLSSNSSYMALRFPNQPTTLTGFKNYVKEKYDLGQPIKFVYAVAEDKITEEDIDLPEILTDVGNNTIEVLTELQPSNMEIEYYGTKF